MNGEIYVWSKSKRVSATVDDQRKSKGDAWMEKENKTEIDQTTKERQSDKTEIELVWGEKIRKILNIRPTKDRMICKWRRKVRKN